jgi:hypothetical protein
MAGAWGGRRSGVASTELVCRVESNSWRSNGRALAQSGRAHRRGEWVDRGCVGWASDSDEAATGRRNGGKSVAVGSAGISRHGWWWW